MSVCCGLAVTLASGLQGDTVGLNQALKASGGTSTGGSHRLRHVLIVAEIALAVVLLVGTGLMIRSVRKVASIEPGFDAKRVLTLHVSIPNVPITTSSASLSGNATPRSRPAVASRALLDRVRALPGVAAVALGSDLPLDGNSVAVFYAAEGHESTIDPRIRPRAYQHRVSADLFDTLCIRILNGRTFTADEMTPSSNVVMVSRSLAERFWSTENAVGKRIKFGTADADNPWLTIVGVVDDVKYRRLPDSPDSDPDLYLPFADRNSQVAIAVRTIGPPSSMTAVVRAAVRAANPSIAVFGVASMDSLMERQTSRFRFVMWLMTVFAVIALSLALIGIYGVLSYLVGQRTREIGIRIALGARREAVIGLILRHTAVFVAIGLGGGFVIAAFTGRLLEQLLFGVGVVDWSTYAAVAFAFALAAMVASYIPARRAARIDPVIALRCE